LSKINGDAINCDLLYLVLNGDKCGVITMMIVEKKEKCGDDDVLYQEAEVDGSSPCF